MPCRNPWRLYIHLAFTYSIGPSSVVWSELGPALPFPPMRVLEVQWSHAPNLVCEVALRFVLNTIQLDHITLTLGPSCLYVGQISLKVECEFWTMVSGPNLVTSLEWTPIFEWCVVRCGSKNTHEMTYVSNTLKSMLEICEPFYTQQSNVTEFLFLDYHFWKFVSIQMSSKFLCNWTWLVYPPK